jgi:hypothetical protein
MTTVTGSTVQPEPEAPPPPSDQTPQPPTALEIMLARFDAIDKRLDQHATALVRLSEIAAGPGTSIAQGAPGESGGDFFGNIIALLRQGLTESGSGMDALYRDVGEKVIGSTIDSAVKRIVKSTGADAASHVTGKLG